MNCPSFFFFQAAIKRNRPVDSSAAIKIDRTTTTKKKEKAEGKTNAVGYLEMQLLARPLSLIGQNTATDWLPGA